MKDKLREKPRKPKKPCRFGLTLLFSFVVFCVFLLTFFIVSTLSYLIIEAGHLEQFERQGAHFMIVIILFASVVVGTLVSLIAGRLPLRPIRRLIAAINRLADGDFSVRMPNSRMPEFKALAESFNRMAEELGSTEVLRSDFINNFSHEFKTPIVSIKGFAEMLRRDDLTEEERNEYLDIIVDESARLSMLSTNVLNLSKVETQAILAERAPYNLGEQLRRAILLLEAKWHKKGISLDLAITDATYTGNEDLMNQVWLNLLDNAIKFTPKSGTVSVTLFEENGQLLVTVEDSGCGIAPESLPLIFDRFYQADKSHSTLGNGLGLTVADRIVRLHGGSISVESPEGEGAVFTVMLPL